MSIKTIEIKLHTDFVHWLFLEWEKHDVINQMLFNEFHKTAKEKSIKPVVP